MDHVRLSRFRVDERAVGILPVGVCESQLNKSEPHRSLALFIFDGDYDVASPYNYEIRVCGVASYCFWGGCGCLETRQTKWCVGVVKILFCVCSQINSVEQNSKNDDRVLKVFNSLKSAFSFHELI